MFATGANKLPPPGIRLFLLSPARCLIVRPYATSSELSCSAVVINISSWKHNLYLNYNLMEDICIPCLLKQAYSPHTILFISDFRFEAKKKIFFCLIGFRTKYNKLQLIKLLTTALYCFALHLILVHIIWCRLYFTFRGWGEVRWGWAKSARSLRKFLPGPGSIQLSVIYIERIFLLLSEQDPLAWDRHGNSHEHAERFL